MNLIGEFAAIFTAFCWSISAVAFTISGRRIGSQVVNRIRVLIAFVLLIAINWIFYSNPIPIQAGADRWSWLLLSGLVGLAIGDAFLFKAYQLIGARMGLLLLSLAPVFSAIIAWIFLEEVLTPIQFIGMLLSLVGISWVVLVRRDQTDDDVNPRQKRIGILFGILAALGQAGGLILSRQGMTENFPPFAGTLIRMIAAVVVLWGLAIIQRQAGPTLITAKKQFSATRWILLGAIFGPVIGVSSSLLAIQYAKLGVASTLMALPPVLMLPISYFAFKERFGWQAVAGTLISIAGVAILFTK